MGKPLARTDEASFVWWIQNLSPSTSTPPYPPATRNPVPLHGSQVTLGTITSMVRGQSHLCTHPLTIASGCFAGILGGHSRVPEGRLPV